MDSQFFPNILPSNTAALLTQFRNKQPDFLKTFYLSGDTALSLQVGHRESEDLDFFSSSPINPQVIERQLFDFGSLTGTEIATGTLNTFLNGVKLQFLAYPYMMLLPLVPWEGVPLSSVEDIACTKLQTVGMRSSKKDFIDIYFLLKKYSLVKLLSLTQQKYHDSDYSQSHILKSLVYFNDADLQPMPRMHVELSWEEIKNSITATVKSFELT